MERIPARRGRSGENLTLKLNAEQRFVFWTYRDSPLNRNGFPGIVLKLRGAAKFSWEPETQSGGYLAAGCSI